MMVRKMVEVGVIDPSLYLGGVASLSWEGEEKGRGREGGREGGNQWGFLPRHLFLDQYPLTHSLILISPSLFPSLPLPLPPPYRGCRGRGARL